MNSPVIQEFIRQHSNLFWYTPEDKKPEISLDFLVETILNYGTMDDVRELIRILGIRETADIFFASINKSERRKGNYYELTLHYFTLFFKRYALGNSN